MSRPTMLLVGETWHTLDYLGRLATTLEAAGYPTKALGLPHAGASPSKPDCRNDVALIRSSASRLVSEENWIVAFLHSFGEIAGTEALRGSVMVQRRVRANLPATVLIKEWFHLGVQKLTHQPLSRI